MCSGRNRRSKSGDDDDGLRIWVKRNAVQDFDVDDIYYIIYRLVFFWFRFRISKVHTILRLIIYALLVMIFEMLYCTGTDRFLYTHTMDIFGEIALSFHVERIW